MATTTIPTTKLKIGDRFRLRNEPNHDYIVTETGDDSGLEIKPLVPGTGLHNWWTFDEMPATVELVAEAPDFQAPAGLRENHHTYRNEVRQAMLKIGDQIEGLRYIAGQPSNETGATVSELTAIATAIARAEEAMNALRLGFGDL